MLKLKQSALSVGNAFPSGAAERRSATLHKEEMGQRGKRAEKSVKDHLKKMSDAVATFAYERLPDARSSGGRVPAQISDYMCWWWRDRQERICIPLEVKSIEHDYRLPKANLDQLPRLNKSALAGTFPLVLVHFKTVDLWRIAPSSYFKFGQPSWDMRDLPTYPTPIAAMTATGHFPTLKV